MTNQTEVAAAIAMALHEHFGATSHDTISGKLTIASHATQWNGYALQMTQRP